MKSNDDEKSQVIYKGDWEIDPENNVVIECYVTKGGKRFLSLRGTARALDLRGAGSTAIVRNLKAQWIQEYLSEGLKAWLRDIESGNMENITGKGGSKVIPLQAELFVDICKAYVNAQRAGLFADNKGKVIPKWERQNDIANKLFAMMSAFTKVGIIAFIDEITGYQEVRDRHNLEKILAMFIAEELRPWVKTFPDEYYEKLFGLRGWIYRPLSVKRPKVVGKITNDLIYERLAPGVLTELKKVTPRDEKGRLKHKYFQKLTENFGYRKLLEHIASVVTLMKASPNWTTFYRLLQRSLPKYGDNYELPLKDIDIEKMQ